MTSILLGILCVVSYLIGYMLGKANGGIKTARIKFDCNSLDDESIDKLMERLRDEVR